MIRVLIADDHQLFAESLALGIAAVPDLMVVETAANGREALAALARHDVDVLVMDLEMPEVSGLEMLKAKDLHPPTIVVTMHASADQQAAAFDAGASAFLAKSTPLGDLAAAIRAVDAGIDFQGNTTLSEILDLHREPKLDAGATSLTARERELLAKMAEGLTSTPDLASELFISEKTVKNHLASIYDKLDVNDRAQAVVEAINRGVVTARPRSNGSADL